MKPIRLMIVEDHPIYVEGLRTQMQANERIEVIGTADSGVTAIRMARDHQPDVVLMDIQLQGEMDGIETTRNIRAAHPKTRILILSGSADIGLVSSAMAACASGYLLKYRTTDQIIRAVESIVDGMLVFDPEIAPMVKRLLVSPVESGEENWDWTRDLGLTAKQSQVARLWYRGDSIPEIASHLRLQPKTVENHVSALCNTLKVHREDLSATLSERMTRRSRPGAARLAISCPDFNSPS